MQIFLKKKKHIDGYVYLIQLIYTWVCRIIQKVRYLIGFNFKMILKIFIISRVEGKKVL